MANIGRDVIIASKEAVVLLMDNKAKIALRLDKMYTGKKNITLIFVTLLALFYAGSALAATTMFISPKNIDVPIRRGSSEKYKIIKIAQVNDQVELLEEKDGWSRVRFKGQDVTEGWLPSRFLTSEIPAEKQL